VSSTEAAPSVEETLARESAWRVRAGIASIVSGLCTLGGGVAAGLVYQDFPRVLLVDALRESAGEDIGRPGLRTLQIQFYDDKLVTLLLLSIVLAIGALAMAVTLTYLARATSARRPEFPRAVIYAVLAGPVLLAVSEMLLQIVVAVRASDFVGGGDLGTQAAHDALRSDFIVVSQILRQVALLALGFAFVLVCLNAMRAGLLTRFMGTLGIIVGVLFVIPIGGQLPVVQSFWLVAIGFLFLGLWPGRGVPPAWTTGTAVPWPSQQQVREERDRERGTAGPPPAARPTADDGGPVLPEAGPGTPKPKPHSSSKKKRKKR
jgi:hypothetical protein